MLPTTTVAQALQAAMTQLQATAASTPRLDAQVLLSDVLQQDKSWLLAHDGAVLSAQELRDFTNLVAARAQGQPLAYIRGQQEFYGRTFIVNSHVLIPRPESETLIELLLDKLAAKPSATILDVGTGSGCLAITLKLQMPAARVFACDISSEALEIARKNATRLHANIEFLQSNLLAHAPKSLTAIVANLPYVDRRWQVSPETRYEPDLALFAPANGLALISQLIAQAPSYLAPRGLLALEADPRQHQAIIDQAASQDFLCISQKDFAILLQLR